MKKSAFTYAIAFIVGQIVVPSVSYSQYQNVPDSPRPAIDKNQRSSSTDEIRDYQQQSGLYSQPGAAQSASPSASSGSVNNPSAYTSSGYKCESNGVCYDNETGLSTHVQEPAPQVSATRQAASANENTGGGEGAGNGTSGIVPRPDSVDNDLMGKQLQSHVEINAAMQKLGAIVAPARGINFIAKGYPKLLAASQKYQQDKPTCVSRHAGAAKACLEHLSDNMISGVSAVNSLMSALGVAVNDNCSDFAKGMNLAKAAMTAYTGVCGTMKAGCGLSCVSARKSLESIQVSIKENAAVTCVPIVPPADPSYASFAAECKARVTAYEAALGQLTKAASEELVKATKESMAGKASLCTEKYAQLATSAVAGIASLISSANQGNSCEKDSNGTGTTVTADKCADPKNAQLQECICLRSPRTPGCVNALDKGETIAGNRAGTGATDRTNSSSKSGIPGGLTNGAPEFPEFSSRDATSAGVGAPTGSGGAGLGSGGGSGGGVAGGEGGGARKGIDANILNGAGGGGGGSWGAAGRGSSSDKYRAYLPGGAKDPSRGIAGQQDWKNEVTGQGGKSNWEKVKERYRENKNSLLNN